jgi:hypothetical protein
MYQKMKIAADIADKFIMVITDSTLTLTLPAGLKKDEFTSIMAEVVTSKGVSGIDLKTKVRSHGR